MSTNNPLNNDFVFSRKPLVTEPMIRSLILRLAQNDDAAKEPMIKFIHHRLNGRYIQPLLHFQDGYASGFLMMAASCLLIEAIQSFYQGLDTTNGCSTESFKSFFKREKEFFPKFEECFPKYADNRAKKENFYSNIRCAILHQAETTGGYRIVRDKSPLFDKNEKTINADKFVEALEKCLDKYFKDLRSSSIDSLHWKNAIKKITFICDNCRD